MATSRQQPVWRKRDRDARRRERTRRSRPAMGLRRVEGSRIPHRRKRQGRVGRGRRDLRQTGPPSMDRPPHVHRRQPRRRDGLPRRRHGAAPPHALHEQVQRVHRRVRSRLPRPHPGSRLHRGVAARLRHRRLHQKAPARHQRPRPARLPVHAPPHGPLRR